MEAPNVSTEEKHFVYLYTNYTKKAFVDALRVAFAHDATPLKYRYDKNINASQVDIRSDFPQRIIKTPMIVVTVGQGNANVTYVGDEFIKETTIEEDGVDGYLYGGQMTLDVDIKIFAGSMRDCEHLADIVTLYVRYLFRNKFADNKLAYTEVTTESISQEDALFKSGVGTKVTLEFTHFLERELYEEIQSMTFEIGTYFQE